MQHEYRIFGADDDAEVVDVIKGINAATIVVLHTVLDHPTANQRRIIEDLAGGGDALVTMTRIAHRRPVGRGWEDGKAARGALDCAARFGA